MIVVGLTGSIGMGKSTTAAMFAARGVPVFDADAAVHRLYAGPLAAAIDAAFPGAAAGGAVDRAALSARVVGRPEDLKRLEAIVHPAVREAEAEFLNDARRAGADVVVLDIPLLFETGRANDVDRVVVVTADPDVQRARVLARPGMSAEKFDAILRRQLHDTEKRQQADYIVDTTAGLDAAQARVDEILAALRAEARRG